MTAQPVSAVATTQTRDVEELHDVHVLRFDEAIMKANN
jgi:hypothetical protein